MGEIEQIIAEKFIEEVPEFISKLLTKVDGRYLPGYVEVPGDLVPHIDGDKLIIAVKPLCEAHPDLELIYWKKPFVEGALVGGIIHWQQRASTIINKKYLKEKYG